MHPREHILRRTTRTLLRLVVVAVLALIAGLLTWVQFVGFGPGLTARVAEALSAGDLRIEIGRLRFNPVSGLIADDCRADLPNGTAAEIAQLSISPNIAALVRGRIAVDSLRVRGADVRVPFADDGVQPDAVTIHVNRVDVFQSPTHLRIPALELAVAGIRIEATADLVLPDGGRERKPRVEDPDAAARRAAAIRSVLAALDAITFGSPGPLLRLDVRGDLGEPSSIEAPVLEFIAGPIRYRELALDRWDLAASYSGGILVVHSCDAEGPDTHLSAHGEWDTSAAAGAFFVDGTVNPAAVLASFDAVPLAEDVGFLEGASLVSEVRLELGGSEPDIRATGRIESGGFQIREIAARKFSAEFAWHNGRLFAQDAKLVLDSGGEISADVLHAPGDFRLRVHSDADPTKFLPIMGRYERAVIETMEFRDPPVVSLEVSGDRPHMDVLSGRGTARLGRTAMRGAWIESATTDMVIGDRAVTYENIRLKMDGREATGAFTYDFGRREVRLGNIRSHVSPTDILMWVDPRIAETVSDYRFRSPPYVEADGLVHMENPDKNDLRIRVDAPGGLDYTLLDKSLPFGPTRGTVNLLGQKVIASIPTSSLYGGAVAIDAEVVTNPANPSLSADVRLERVDFASVTKRYFDYEKSEGLMSGNYKFSMDLRDDGTMRGEGSIRVEEGHVLAIPVFGPLSEIISAIIPGAGHDAARLATTDFSIADRVITSPNLEVEGNGFTLFGSGDIRYPSGAMDMTVRINARGISGIVLFPVSKLLEYVSTGTVSDPQWRPKIVPKEFFELLGLGGGNGVDEEKKPSPGDSAKPSPTRPRGPRTR